jgi:hypothetical protein
LVYLLFHAVAIVVMISPVSIYGVDYCLKLFGPTDNLFFGYLFLCPLAEFQVDTPTSFRVPAQLAYLSLDASGVKRLSGEVVEDLGFPSIKFGVDLWGRTWDASVYDGIRQFHEAKGFDPYSQEAALELGCRPVQLLCDREALLAHRTHVELRVR